MNEPTTSIAVYAKAASRLLQGPVFDDQKDLWEDLTYYEIELSQYFGKIGLEIIIDKREGYAFLKQIELDEKGTTIGLIRRILLNYEQSLVCVLIREWLMEFETNDTETRNLYITPKQFRERLELFFKEKANELKFIRELNRYMSDMEKLGFLKLVSTNAETTDENRYEVKRIIKARVSIDEMNRFLTLLQDES